MEMSLTFQWSPSVTGVSKFLPEFLGIRSFFLPELGGCRGAFGSVSSINADSGSLDIFPDLDRGVRDGIMFWRLGSGVLSTRGRCGSSDACLVVVGASLSCISSLFLQYIWEHNLMRLTRVFLFKWCCEVCSIFLLRDSCLWSM